MGAGGRMEETKDVQGVCNVLKSRGLEIGVPTPLGMRNGMRIQELRKNECATL